MDLQKIRSKAFSPSIIFPLAVFAASLVFRVTNLNLIEFKTDEALNLFLASRPLFGHPFVSGGTVSSVGILNPPFFNYILLPIAFISLDPRFISFFIALVNCLAIVMLFLLVKKYYSTTLAFISAFLMSFSPWAILYSRKIWMQDLLIPFSVVLLFSIHKLVSEKKESYWILYTASSLFLLQLHQASAAFIFIIAIFVFLQKVKINFKYAALGLSIGLIPLLPYLLFEITNKCPDCYGLLASSSKLNRHYFVMFFRPLQIVGQGDFRFVLGDDITILAQKFPLAYTLRKIFYVEYLLLPLGMLIFMRRFKNFSFLVYVTILLTFVYFLLKIEPFMHYYIIVLPLLFVFLATTFDYFIKSKSKLLKLSSSILLMLIITSSILFNYAFFSILKTQGKTKGDYESTFLSLKKKADVKLGKYKNQPDYNERFLSNYVPISYMYGYLPLGKMLYGNLAITEIPRLERQLKNDPEDLRVQYQLLALYTKKPETLQTLDILEEKSIAIPEYRPIYKEIYQHYLSWNLKKAYTSYIALRTFFYPQHWNLIESKNEILLKGDGYDVIIKNLGMKDMSVNCIDGNNKCKKDVIEEIVKSIRPISN